MCKTKRVLNAYQTTKEGFLQKCSSNLETSTKRSGLLKPTPLILKPTPLIEFLNSISALFLLSLWKDKAYSLQLHSNRDCGKIQIFIFTFSLHPLLML